MESKQFDDKFRQLSKKESAGNIDFNDLDTEANSLAAQAHKKAGTIVKDKGKKASTAKLDNYNVLQNVPNGFYFAKILISHEDGNVSQKTIKLLKQ